MVRRAILMLFVLLVALAGCLGPTSTNGMHGGHGDGHGHSHMPGATGPGWGTMALDGSEAIVVDVVAGQPEEFRFVPDALAAAKGQRIGVRFANNGTAPHEFDLPAFGFHLHAEPGQTVAGAFVAETAGAFEFACHLAGHYEAGMKGTVTVTA